MRYVVRVTHKETTYHFFDNLRKAFAWIATQTNTNISRLQMKEIEQDVCRSLKQYTFMNGNTRYELEWIVLERGDVHERLYVLEHKLEELRHHSSSSNTRPSMPTSASHVSAK